MLPLSAEPAAGFAFVCQRTARLQIGFSPWLTPGWSQRAHAADICATCVNNERFGSKEGRDQVLSSPPMRLRKLPHTRRVDVKY